METLTNNNRAKAIADIEPKTSDAWAPTPDTNILKEWLAKKDQSTKQEQLLNNEETAALLYVNDEKQLVLATILANPKDRTMRKTYYICQQGNEILVPDPAMLSKEALLGFVLVPMKRVTAIALNLSFDPHDIATPYANTAGTFSLV